MLVSRNNQRNSFKYFKKRKNIKFKVGNFRLKKLIDADEVFLTGTASEIINVCQIDNKRFKKEK